jgi:hypothetical protein
MSNSARRHMPAARPTPQQTATKSVGRFTAVIFGSSCRSPNLSVWNPPDVKALFASSANQKHVGKDMKGGCVWVCVCVGSMCFHKNGPLRDLQWSSRSLKLFRLILLDPVQWGKLAKSWSSSMVSSGFLWFPHREWFATRAACGSLHCPIRGRVIRVARRGRTKAMQKSPGTTNESVSLAWLRLLFVFVK